MQTVDKTVLQIVQVIEQLQEVLADQDLVSQADPPILAEFTRALDALDVAIARIKRITC